MKALILSLLTLALGACSIAPVSQTDVANGDYGPFPENYKTIVSEYYRPTLKDPYSAVYVWNVPPFKCYLRDAPVKGGKPREFGFCTFFKMNAKNSYGAYVGERQERLFIKNGVARELKTNPWFDEPWFK